VVLLLLLLVMDWSFSGQKPLILCFSVCVFLQVQITRLERPTMMQQSVCIMHHAQCMVCTLLPAAAFHVHTKRQQCQHTACDSPREHPVKLIVLHHPAVATLTFGLGERLLHWALLI
jgi:hypothetical protein